MRTLRPNVRLDLPRHPRFKGFEAFAAREIFPYIASREVERREVVRRAKMFGIAGALIVFGAIVLAFFDAIGIWGAVAVAIVVTLIAAFAAFWPLMSFAEGFNDFLVARTCEHLKLRHTGANANLPVARFLEAKLLPQPVKHRFEDGIECEDPDLAFSAAETRLIDSSAAADNEDTTVWRGLLMDLPVQRQFEGHTLVVPKRGKLQLAVDKRGMERIELGLGDLEERFEIRTTHPAETRAVLTDRVMRRLADLSHRLGNERPALALFGSDILVAIESGRNRFQGGSMFKPIDLTEQLNRITADIALLFDLAKELRDALEPRRGARPA